jgi:hypothetical protein
MMAEAGGGAQAEKERATVVYQNEESIHFFRKRTFIGNLSVCWKHC